MKHQKFILKAIFFLILCCSFLMNSCSKENEFNKSIEFINKKWSTGAKELKFENLYVLKYAGECVIEKQHLKRDYKEIIPIKSIDLGRIDIEEKKIQDSNGEFSYHYVMYINSKGNSRPFISQESNKTSEPNNLGFGFYSQKDAAFGVVEALKDMASIAKNLKCYE